MSVTTGLAGLLQKRQEQDEKEAARNRPKAEYFSWKDNSKAPEPNTVYVQFLQELDPGATGYREEAGLAVAAVEHEAPGPKGYLARALCTIDSEGQCYACERKKADYQEGWKTKTNLYVNALVDYNGKGDPVVRVISRNFNQLFARELMDHAVENGSITDTVFKVTRIGSGTQTIWSLKAVKRELFDVSDAETFNIQETVLRDISYDKQPAYFARVWDGAEGSGEAEAAPAAGNATAADDVEW